MRISVALFSFGNHLGTHVDAPAHYMEGGITVDQIPPDVLVGPGVVLDMRGKSQIDRQVRRNAYGNDESSTVL